MTYEASRAASRSAEELGQNLHNRTVWLEQENNQLKAQIERLKGFAAEVRDEFPCDSGTVNALIEETSAQSLEAILENSATFQARVKPWMDVCFGEEISSDTEERNHRFLEESLELVQACDCTASEAHQLVDYVFGRSVGEKPQEVGGVMVTLAALCLAQKMDMQLAGEIELERIWTKVEAIRVKQAAKPKHSPLPEHPATDNT